MELSITILDISLILLGSGLIASVLAGFSYFSRQFFNKLRMEHSADLQDVQI